MAAQEAARRAKWEQEDWPRSKSATSASTWRLQGSLCVRATTTALRIERGAFCLSEGMDLRTPQAFVHHELRSADHVCCQCVWLSACFSWADRERGRDLCRVEPSAEEGVAGAAAPRVRCLSPIGNRVPAGFLRRPHAPQFDRATRVSQKLCCDACDGKHLTVRDRYSSGANSAPKAQCRTEYLETK